MTKVFACIALTGLSFAMAGCGEEPSKPMTKPMPSATTGPAAPEGEAKTDEAKTDEAKPDEEK